MTARRFRHRSVATAVAVSALAASALVLSACSGSGSAAKTSSGASTPPASTTASGSMAPSTSASGSAAPSSTVSTSASGGSGAALTGNLYVSLGDSYAAGYQPTGKGQGHTTTNGFAYQLVNKAKAKGYDLTLVNFGCAGATTTSILKSVGCKRELLGPGAPTYPNNTQAAAAEAYLRAHRGKVALVTVAIGGNDVTACALEANPISCLTTALGTVKTNLTTLLSGVRSAAGPTTKIVGITYPDVLLGDALASNAQTKQLANLSLVAFKQLINPTLQAAYTAAGGSFVDVTTATGAYGSMSQTTNLPPYGKIPTPVAKICQLTYFCQYEDIHPRTDGYAIIANLIAATLPKK